MNDASDALRTPTFREAARFWLKLGFISFGGPTGQIAIMHAELVERRRWISEDRFLHALNYCMLLPGPEAQQLATYVGWLLHRTRGGVVAGALFVLPSALILWVLSLIYVTCGKLAWVAAIFDGLKPAVLAIIAMAVVRIGRRILKNRIMWLIATLAFGAIFFLQLPFPAVIVAAAIAGLIGSRVAPEAFRILKTHGTAADGSASSRPSISRAVRVVVCGLALWWIPILLTGAVLGWNHVLFREGLFFSKAAMVTFGGAYAVLPYVSQQAVENYHWLLPGQMLDGLGLAETTPGPLIMVLQFVGFVGAWNLPEPFVPVVAATLGALVTTWATFLPCFLWIFLGAPFIEHLRENHRVTAALSAVTAAVVGVVLNLAVWFGWHVLAPAWEAVNLWGIVVASAAFLALRKWNVVPVILASAGLGFLRWFAGW